MKSKLLIFILLFLSVACSEDDKNTPKPAATPVALLKTEQQFIKDGPGGLFNNVKWYSYDMQSHTIWSHHDVYVIKTASQLYKLQILNYYNPSNPNLSGHYSLRIERPGKAAYTVELDASACGTIYTNPNGYTACAADPDKNVFTYLNLKNFKVQRLSDEKAKTSRDWHLGFKNTTVILNGGSAGPLDTVGALLYRDQSLFPNGGQNADIARLQERVGTDIALTAFASYPVSPALAFYPPEGIDRVIHETYWYKEEAGTLRALDQNWWLVKSNELNTVSRIHIASIQTETLEPDLYHLKVEHQAYETAQEIIVSFKPAQEIVEACLDFDSNQIIHCSDDAWEIKFVSVPDTAQGFKWRIFTNNGAMGPFSIEDAIAGLEARAL